MVKVKVYMRATGEPLKRKHFRSEWGPEAGSNAALHRLFPQGGPQKQGNRLTGLLRTKGEH